MIRRPMIGLVAKIEADKNYWSSLLFSKPKPLTIFVWTATQAGLVIFLTHHLPILLQLHWITEVSDTRRSLDDTFFARSRIPYDSYHLPV